MNNLTKEINKYTEQLDQWIQSLGIPKYNPPNSEIETILGFTRDNLRERSSIQLSEDTVLLAQFSLFLQQKTNECQTFIRWSNQVNNLTEDDNRKLNNWIKQIELRLERIQYLARRIEFIGQNINNLIRTRYNEGKNQ